jgi:hypothetical protein
MESMPLTAAYGNLVRTYPDGSIFGIKNGGIAIDNDGRLVLGNQPWFDVGNFTPFKSDLWGTYLTHEQAGQNVVKVRPQLSEVETIRVEDSPQNGNPNAVRFLGAIPIRDTGIEIAGLHTIGEMNKGVLVVTNPGQLAVFMTLFG